MKKLTLCLMIMGLSFVFSPFQSNATTVASTTSASKTTEAAEAKLLLLRLNEINKMDKSNLSAAAKKNLRTEVLTIRERLEPMSGGVYLSVGAIILILLILIILF